MNERIQELRKNSVEGTPFLTEERARLVTEAYKMYESKVSQPLLQALVFKHLLENKSISIQEGELIVGEKGTLPLAAPTYPELCCHSLEDLDIINNREKISFRVSKEMKNFYSEVVIPYWQGKTIREKIFSSMTPEWKDAYNAGVFTEFMEQRSPGHTVCDEKLYNKGFIDFKKDINNSLKSIDHFNDPNAYEKKQELEAMQICADAIINLAVRYSELAKSLADKEKNDTRRQELLKISEVTSKVPAFAPTSFWEALQMYWFVHIGVTSESNTWDAFSPGRLDQHLFPFFMNDLNKGTLNYDFAKELLECLWVKFNNQPAPPKVGVTLKESGTYTDFAAINIGGIKVDGNNAVNEVSYLLLDVIDEMRLVQPSSNIQLSKKNPDKFLKHACEVIKKGWGQPSVFNADAVVDELLRQGKSIEDARCGGTSGCVESGAFGKESYILTGYFNLVKVLEITLNNGIDPRTNKKIGLQTGSVHEFISFEQLLAAYEIQLNYFIDIKIKGNNIIEKIYALNMPAPFLSIIIDDCIVNGRDYNAGGPRYNTTYIQGVGIGTITDSLAAIKCHVFEKKNIGIDKLLYALKENFNNMEDVHQQLLNKTPRYGNDNDFSDSIMIKVFNMYFNAIHGRKNTKGGTYGIDMLPTTCHVYFGSVIGATPDGRLAGVPLSEGISPVQGADHEGPTAVLKSAAKMDQLRTGGTLLNLKFTPNLFDNPEGIAGMASLIKSYFKLDGHHIQFNVVHRKVLLEAQKYPEKHKNLIVRIAGYSDYFCNLNTELQNEIIERTEHCKF